MKKLFLTFLVLILTVAFVSAQVRQITGVVTSLDDGTPIPGVSVVVKGTIIGTVTDLDGKFSIEASDADVLTFSFVGMLTQEIPVEQSTEVNVAMEPDLIGLDEVVVIGYGTMVKKDLTGAVATIRGEELQKLASQNLGQAIQGKMPGVQVTQSSGAPGAGSSIRIRGEGSILSGNNPLVLVDGLPGDYSRLGDEIESVTVLKDAASTAIYGAEAANGVILITTKRGQADKMKVNFNADFSQQTIAKPPMELLDYAGWREVKEYMGETVPNPASDPNVADTDWFDYIYNNAPMRRYGLSMSGGSDKARYMMHLGYYNQGGIVGVDAGGKDRFDQFNVRLNLDSRISKLLDIGANITFEWSNRNNDVSTEGMIDAATRTSPGVPIYNSDGTISGGYPGIVLTETPGEMLGRFDESTVNNRSMLTTFANFHILDGLDWRTTLSGSISNGDYMRFNKTYEYFTWDGSPGSSGPDFTSLNQRSNEGWSARLQSVATYHKIFDNVHDITAMAGTEWDMSGGKSFSVSGGDVSEDGAWILSLADPTMFSGSGGKSEASSVSFFGRLMYSYANKYLFQTNFRRDGTYKFSPDHRWGFFPSFSAGWRLSEEAFIQNVVLISNLKLRGGYGVVGNSGVSPFGWVSTINVGGNVQMGMPMSLYGYAVPMGYSNKELMWESTATSNIGLDIGILENKLALELDIYSRKTSDMLLNKPFPSLTGMTGTVMVNAGEMVNKGVEISLYYNERIGDLNLKLNGNLSRNKNEITSLGGAAPWGAEGNDVLRYQEGYSYQAFWGYKTTGIWDVDPGDTDIHRPGVRAGDLRFADLNSSKLDPVTGETVTVYGVPDSVINIHDKTFLGNSIPDFIYGFGLNLDWKGIDLTAFFQGEAGKYIYNEPVFANDPNNVYGNMYRDLWENRWQGPGTGTYPRIGSNMNSSNNPTDFWLEKADYIRCKNLQIGYTIPISLTRKLSIQTIRVYAGATNLFTITKYRGNDPETNKKGPRGGIAYPQIKTYSFGLNVTF